MSRSNSPRRRRGGNAPPVHRGVCRPSGGKYQYTSRRAARDHLRRLLALGDRAGAHLNVYKCGECSDWHVGHRPRRGEETDA